MKAIEHIRLKVEGAIAIITIDHPPVNALSMQTMAELHEVLTEIEQKKEVKVVLLRGNEKLFVAGADLYELLKTETNEEAYKMSKLGHELMDRIENFPIPVIALVEGACLGGGLELAMACHIRIAKDNAIFGLPEITLGIIPGAGGTQRLPKLIESSKAIEMILTGRRISAGDAKNLGLVLDVYSEESFEQEAFSLANNIADKGKVAITSALKAIQAGLHHSEQEGFEVEANLFGLCCTTNDKQEGISAFLNKRKAKFEDR
ncbi:enoyl-CoA hydratase-related protein [Calidifontibacillus erzurumensis]|uniref:Enoyl-CoA hydratase/isomerase family protein n=1 Tax=Calidifontibacillus erzurumensis TaxID=2741433 RepID=A0A8J8GB87_9BACI|nr:enoyl-CoA hydratase-related protein [Calidifontibacillus erzurumensis]NSL50507.1 enoyl-CoA hydratase/isomerase family protein [Calidifontibacillus erzurumensis]